MLRISLALIILSVSFLQVCRADYASDFKERVKIFESKYQELDKRAAALISEATKADFKKYAELRNEMIRFISESRQEVVRARAVGDQNSAQRVQTDQELKILLTDLDVDLTDDDSKPIPATAVLPRIENAINDAKQQLEQDNKTYSDLVKERSAKMQKARASENTEEKQALNEEARKLFDEVNKARSMLAPTKSKIEQLKKAKDLLTRSLEYSNFSLQFRPEIERLEAQDSRANQRIQQIDEAIFNLLLVESNDKRYTLYSTLVFGVAVVIVIGAFFFVAYKSEAIRASIFANDSGLQFVTLFSLVIAIILFGVLKILEGKELAALLGGLSGYILGRGGISRQQSPPAAPVTPAAPVVPAGPPVGPAPAI